MAIELRQALESGNIGLADSIVTKMEARVRGEQLVKNLRSSKANLEEFLSNWGKVIKVRSNISEVAIPESIQATVESIIMEAVNDAVRHGSASWVDVRLGRDVNQITIQVESDSSPDSNSPSIGIGSQTLAQVAPNSWSRGFSESGNYVLTARL
jgi:anti-sigma regulatory factor (Ser/Thr protein kinase)